MRTLFKIFLANDGNSLEPNLPDEEWAMIPDYPLYEASTKGRVRKYTRSYCKLVKTYINPKEYPIVRLSAGGKQKTIMLKKVIMAAFSDMDWTDQVRELDKDRNNCELSNLEIYSYYQDRNMRAAYKRDILEFIKKATTEELKQLNNDKDKIRLARGKFK